MLSFSFKALQQVAREAGASTMTPMSAAERAFWTTYQRRVKSDTLVLVREHVVNGQGVNHDVPYRYSYRIDFAYPDFKIGIEIDGYEYHHGQDAIVRDHRRQRQLERDGWRFIRFAAKEIFDDPVRCMNELVLSVNYLT